MDTDLNAENQLKNFPATQLAISNFPELKLKGFPISI